MSRVSTRQFMLCSVQEIYFLIFAFWKNRFSSVFTKSQFKKDESKDITGSPFHRKNKFSLSGPSLSASESQGFASILMLTALPVLLAALMFFAFSSFLVKNWMQSLHTCRSELIHTQKDVARDLESLLKLNPLAQTLRMRLKIAYAKLAFAMASQNWGLAAQAKIEISQIKAQQKQLDLVQKLWIQKANFRMQKGSYKVYQDLRKQNQEIAHRLPWFFSYSIQVQFPRTRLLAVKPDTPGVAPVYELKNNFKHEQALSISWNSHFASGEQKDMKWISNKHIRKDSCSISLTSKNNQNFYPQMIADRW